MKASEATDSSMHKKVTAQAFTRDINKIENLRMQIWTSRNVCKDKHDKNMYFDSNRASALRKLSNTVWPSTKKTHIVV